MTTFEKIDYVPFFVWASRVPVACGTLKNGARKIFFVQKLFLSEIVTFGKCTKKISDYIQPYFNAKNGQLSLISSEKRCELCKISSQL